MVCTEYELWGQDSKDTIIILRVFLIAISRFELNLTRSEALLRGLWVIWPVRAPTRYFAQAEVPSVHFGM
jgi:hypothetical protein